MGGKVVEPAPVYGDGRSLRLLAHILADQRYQLEAAGPSLPTPHPYSDPLFPVRSQLLKPLQPPQTILPGVHT